MSELGGAKVGRALIVISAVLWQCLFFPCHWLHEEDFNLWFHYGSGFCPSVVHLSLVFVFRILSQPMQPRGLYNGFLSTLIKKQTFPSHGIILCNFQKFVSSLLSLSFPLLSVVIRREVERSVNCMACLRCSSPTRLKVEQESTAQGISSGGFLWEFTPSGLILLEIN